MGSISRGRRTGGWLVALMPLCGAAMAQIPVSDVEFQRFAGKDPATLAQKAGGPTERIEVQSTSDNIDYVVKAYVLNNANASELFLIIQGAVNQEGGSVQRLAAGSAVEIGPNGVQTTYEGQSYLIVTAPDWMISYLDKVIATLDVPDLKASAFGTGYAFYKPRNRRPSELAGLVASSVGSAAALAVADDSRNVLYLEDAPSFVGGIVDEARRLRCAARSGGDAYPHLRDRRDRCP